ncbi:Rib/alpha-like domain-containing protein, partial [Lactobacillus amylovorus]
MFVDSADRTPHYSLRKLSVGVASVLLSTTLWMGANGSVAHADTINDTTVAVKASSSAENKSDPSKTQMASKDQKQAQTAESTSQASVASAENQNGETQKGQVQEGSRANAGVQTATANDAHGQAGMTKQEPAAPSQQTASQAQVSAPASAEEQASTAEQAAGQASAAATEGQTNGSANAGAAIDATTKAKKDSANPEANSSDAATEDAKNESTTTLDVSQAFKTSTVAPVNKKMVMARLASAAKLADRYDAKGATKTVIYDQAIDPNSLIANFSSLPTGTKASAANLDSIKTKQGRNVVPVTVTYSDGSSDAANAIVWVTPEGTTALAKSVSLQSNAATDKPEVTVGINTDVPLPFKYTGTAVVNGSDITKGAKIYFSTLSEKYDEYIGDSPTSAINVIDSDNDIIGNLDIYSSQNMRSFMLNVTTTKKYDGDVNIRFDAKNEAQMHNVWQPNRNLHSIYLVNTDEPYDYSGTVVQKRWLHAVGQDDKEYTINRTVSPVEAGTTRGPNGSKIIPSALWQHITIDPQLVGYQGSTANPKNTTITSTEAWKIADEIWKGKGKVKPADLPEEANWHEIFQVTTNISELPDNFNIGNWSLEGDVQVATADGQPSNQSFRLSAGGSLFNAKVVHVADNLSIQQLYDETSSGQIGYSKQANGQFLICFNLSANDIAPKDKTAYANAIIYNMGRNGNIALSKDYDKITKATADFYANNVVPNFAAWQQGFWISVNNAYTSDRKWIMTDVTPGHPAYSVTRTYTAGTASADGESKLTNTAYFVDDNHNQAIVGGQHQISGKKGDTVSLNLTVPSGYILASGQALPTSYTFTGSDSDIVIHLVPIYKSAGQTSDVHRTIDYKMSDGSKAPETKSDDLKFYGTTITGDLSNLTNRAEQDGLKVTKEDAKTYDTKQEALADLDKQASAIQSKVTKYEAEKAAYDTAENVYKEDLKKWNDAQSPTNPDPHMVKGISQSLSFANETDASLNVTSGSDKPVKFIKSSAWLGRDGQGVYTDGMKNGDNISKSFSGSDISYSQAEGTDIDSKGWGKTYTGVQLDVGESVIARYTGLKNSVYIDKNGAAHKLSKAQVKYTLNETTAKDGTANIFLSNNPNIGLWYGAAGGDSNGRVDLTVDLTFYDENGKSITLGKGSNAWLDMSSLNNGTTKVEYFAPNDNTTMQIPGSSIKSHADGWYADNNNEVHPPAPDRWDNPTSADRYYGAAIMELEGNSFHIGQKITKYNPGLTNSRNVYSWFALDSSLATAYKPVEPKAPDKPKIAWHEVTNTTWDGPKDFADVKSPAVKGYTPSQPVVSNKNIAHDPKDIYETVTYTPDAQKATVAYVDKTTGKTLKTDSLTGLTNAKSGYTTADSIKTYQDLGYKLDSDGTDGAEIVFDNDDGKDQTYTVTLEHTFVKVTPKDKIQEGKPINPGEGS